MAITDDQLQALIQVEMNVTGDTNVEDNIALWWGLYAGKGQYLAYLYTKRSVASYLKGQYRKFMTTQLGTDKWNYEQLFKQAGDLYDEANEEIKAIDIGRSTAVLGSTSPTSTTVPDALAERVSQVVLGLPGAGMPGIGWQLP